MSTRERIALAIAALAASSGIAAAQSQARSRSEKPMTPQATVRLMVLDPGHFHASLVQKHMYEQVDATVHVYAPAGPDLDEYLRQIQRFNTRPDNPTRWDEKVYAGPDFFEKMLREKPGNLVVLAGNNARKTEYIAGSIAAGVNVLADKPMAITPANCRLLLDAFKTAEDKHVLLYDIMTERYEITNILQRELSRDPEVFGTLQAGTPEQPAVTKESVHHFSKIVSGQPLIRPPWFFDVNQEGEGIVDVSTHLVDLVQWECFPDETLKPEDVRLLSARRASTAVTPEQFKKVTGLDRYPEFLGKDVKEGVLQVYANGEFVYTLKGHVAKVSVKWRFEAPPGGGDTHYSIMRGSKANLVIQQGKDQGYKPVLYVENASHTPDDLLDQAIRTAVDKLHSRFQGISFKRHPHHWEIVVPDALKTTHEQHFGQVTEKYLGFLAEGRLPCWEVPDMIVRYHTIMEAYKASR
jgi:predicted dehydrogenase